MTLRVVGMVATMIVAGLASGISAAGPRLVVNVDEPFVVDGRTYPAGTLSLRTVHEFTPTKTLSEVWVGDRCLGMLAASRGDDARLEASRNAVLFARDPDGRLELRGFAYRVDGAGDRYRFALLDSRSVSATTSFDEGASPILVAAGATP